MQRRAYRVVRSDGRSGEPGPRRTKAYVFRKASQAIGLLLLAFLLLRVVGPWLVDLHSTPALILAVALLVGGMLLVAWYAWDLAWSLARKRIGDA